MLITKKIPSGSLLNSAGRFETTAVFLLCLMLVFGIKPVQAQTGLSTLEKFKEAEQLFYLNEFGRSERLIHEVTGSLCENDAFAGECVLSKVYLADLNLKRREFENAKNYLDEASELIGDKLSENHPAAIKLYVQYGFYFEEQSELEEAKKWAEKAVNLVNTNKLDRKSKARAYLGLGFIEDTMGNYQQAVDAYNEGLFALEDIDRDIQVLKMFSQAHNNIGIAYRRLGMTDQAMSHYQLALLVTKEAYGENHPELGYAYNSIGTVYYANGDYSTAADYFLQAASTFEDSYGRDNQRVAGGYNNAGLSFFRLEDYEKATEYLERAQRIKESLLGEEHLETAIGYSNLATIHLQNENIEAAEKNYIRSLEVRIKIYGNNHPSTIDPHIQLGKLYIKKSEFQSARTQLNKAVELAIERLGNRHPDVAEAYFEIGNSYAAENNQNDAARYYQTVLEILTEDEFDVQKDRYRIADILDPLLFINTLRSQADLIVENQPETENEKHLKQALDYYNLASETIDQLQNSYQSEASKLNLIDQNYSIYTNAIEVLYLLYNKTGERSYLDQILNVAEKSKARVALELFQDLEAKTVSGVTEEVLAQEKSLERKVIGYYQKLHIEQEKGMESDRDAISAYRDSLFHAQRNLEEFTQSLEKDYPSYYVLKYDRKLADRYDIVSVLNDHETMVIYVVGEKNVYAIIIGGRQMEMYNLGKSRGLTARVESIRRAVLSGNTKAYKEEARALYKKLIEPVRASLQTQDLIIIPDQVLHYLPFEMLLSEIPEHRDYHEFPYLIKDFRFKYAPSATMFEIMMNQKPEISRNLFALAPFHSDGIQAGQGTGIERYLQNLSPLPLTRYETREIGSLFEQHRSWRDFFNREEVEILNGQLATKSRLMKSSLEKYGYIHFATHAFVHESNPSLSGIALQGSEQNDGITYVSDIYNLKMNADLVVLGACETGLGSIYRGEGLIGFTRAFIYAGAANLVVSMWRVNDQPTARLMIEFYRNIRMGDSYGTALQKAKLTLIDHPDTAAPRNWAAFVLNGR